MTESDSGTSYTSLLSSESTSSTSYKNVNRKKKKKPAISAIQDIYGNKAPFNSMSSRDGIKSLSSSWQNITNKFTSDIDVVEEEKNLMKTNFFMTI